MSEKRDRDVEKVYSASEFVAKLRRLADAIERGERFEIQVAGERIYVPAGAEFNVSCLNLWHPLIDYPARTSQTGALLRQVTFASGDGSMSSIAAVWPAVDANAARAPVTAARPLTASVSST